MAKNTDKYLSYKEAWSRIPKAIDQGFYFEAVTLCESIIADRLLSYIQGVDPSSNVGTRTHFATLIRDWRKLAQTLPLHGSSDLGEAVDIWRVERNTIVHGLTKSDPGTPTESLQPFLVRAEEAAKDGSDLARKVSDWHKQELRKAINKARIV